MAQFACVPATHLGTPLARFVALRELHRRSYWRSSHAVPPLIPAHPSHVSWPLGSSTEGPSGRVHMRPGHPGQRCVAPQGAPPKAVVAVSTCVPATHSGTPLTRFVALRELQRRPRWPRPHAPRPPISAHPLHISWPHGELRRRPQWPRPHASRPLISAHPSHVSWPSGSSTKGPSGRVHVRPGHPGQRVVALRELHRRPQWPCPHASWPPRAGIRGL